MLILRHRYTQGHGHDVRAQDRNAELFLQQQVLQELDIAAQEDKQEASRIKEVTFRIPDKDVRLLGMGFFLSLLF
jgi:hypothetical protein